MSSKIKSRIELTKLCAELRAKNKTIGFTSGNFDLLHAGHVAYLEKARALCDVLIVGVNSDSSVKQYKDDGRPICQAEDRAKVVAALGCVDYVFIFDERRNSANIEALKPHIYIKAGDYSKDATDPKAKLTSAPAVEAYGGRVEIIPLLEGHSTSALIGRILEVYAPLPVTVPSKPPEKRPAIFVDRDGVINEEIEYLHEPEKFKLIPGVLEGLKTLQQAGYRIIVITNQSGIGLGYYSKEDFFRVNKVMLRAAGKIGLKIDRVYFCHHSVNEACACRKPAPGMILRAVEDLNVDLSKSFVVGDMSSDIAAGKAAGCRTILVKTGHAGKDGLHDVRADFEVADIAGVLAALLPKVTN